MVSEIDENSLVLLNETYATTCASDGLYLAQDLLHVLKERNCLCIYNTHLHELAKSVPYMNRWDGTSKIVSLAMEIIDKKNTFRVLRREPDTNSYAKNVALKYGITYEQMRNLVEENINLS